ncbi:MAG: methyl-accepting chemotaxis protein [Rhodospirillales bacterium]
MNLTIKSKIIGVGVISLLAIASVSAITFLMSGKIDSATESNLHQQEEIAIVNDMRRANLSVTLAAMDSIIDKDEGVIQPERIEAINDGFAILTDMAARLIERADTPDKKTTAQQIADQIGPLEQGIKIDLAQLIESNAAQDEFTKIDDVIDEYGETMDELLEQYEEEANRSSAVAVENLRGALATGANVTLIALIVSLIVVSGALFVIGRSIINPLNRITAVMAKLADGDTTIEVPARDQTDEIGQIAQAVQVFKDGAIERIRLEKEQANAAQRSEQEKRAQMDKLADTFEASVGGFVSSLTTASDDMKSSAQSMVDVAKDAGGKASTVNSDSETASESVSTVATAAEELTSSISEITQQVDRASQIATNAVRQAESTNAEVKDLATAANKIGEVVALITDIAEQTNLLALNATIEAARAGEAGKGFAVVASEVKSLANQTAKATEDISNQVGGIQKATENAVNAIESIGTTIGEIDEISSALAAAMEEQGAAVSEIANSAENASSATKGVSGNITSVSSSIGEVGNQASSLLAAASKLSDQSASLRQEVDKFLDQVRRG